MTNTYLTGNPVGSTNPRDLYDNASNIDDAVNGTAIEFTDRLLKRRVSWAGMEAAFDDQQNLRSDQFSAAQADRVTQFNTFLSNSGYQFMGAYAAGIVLTGPNQVFTRAGEYYRPGPTVTFPYTLTGDWATEGSKFLSAGDAVLRQELANATAPGSGSALVGRSVQVVKTIAEALALSKLSPSKNVQVLGYFAPGDGGGGLYYIDTTDTTSPDDGGIIRVMADGGRLKLVDTRSVCAEQFGARGDGVTVDDAAIAKMLLVGPGRTVVLSVGKTYLQNTAMQIRSNTALLARGATILRGANYDNMIRNYSDGTIGAYGASSSIRITGGTWDANGATYTTACTPIAFGHATGIEIDSVKVLNVPQYHHIEVNTCQTVKITNGLFLGGAEQAGIYIEAIQIDLNIDMTQFPWFGPADAIRCEDVLIDKCRFENVGVACGTHSFSGATNHNNIRFTNNTVINPYYSGVSGLNWSNTRIIGNSFEGGYYGVSIITSGTSSSRGHVISDNTFYNIGFTAYTGNAGRSIYLSASDNTGANRIRNVTVANNTIIQMTTAGKSSDGIHFNYSDYLSITGNAITATQNFGITTFSCNNVSISGNTCAQNNLSAGGFSSIEINSCFYTNVGHNSVENIRVLSCNQAMVRNNILTIASSLVNTGNTNSAINENLIGGVFA